MRFFLALLLLAIVLAGCTPTQSGHIAPSPAVHTVQPVVPPTGPPGTASLQQAWLASPGGQAQVLLATYTDALFGDLIIESKVPSAANHAAFEATARMVRTQAQLILDTPSLQPTHNRAAYRRLMHDWIRLADALQPGPGYGTVAEDWRLWDAALSASDIEVWGNP